MSDTMCVKTTETSRCQRCGSEFDWLSDGTKVHVGKRYFESDSLLCLERQLNAANESFRKLNIHALDLAARIKRLEEAGDAMMSEPCEYTFEQWLKAKEAKP